jgi:hypothetical protein
MMAAVQAALHSRADLYEITRRRFTKACDLATAFYPTGGAIYK